MRAGDETIHDRVGDGGISDDLVPMLDFHLTGHDGRASILALFDNLQEISSFEISEDREAEVVQDQGAVAIELVQGVLQTQLLAREL